MKKIILLAIAAAALLSSCNRDEIVDRNPQGAISFENAFIDAETRSGELNNSNFNKFYVSGVIKTSVSGHDEFAKVFDNQEVTKSGNAWTYTPAKFWFKGDYDFVAFSHKDASKAVAEITDASTFAANYKISYDNAGYLGNEDLIYAKAQVKGATEAYNTPVALTFKHALARVKFSFKNEMGNDLYTIKVKDIKTNDFKAKGDFTFASATWGNTTGIYAPAFTVTDTAKNNKTISSNVIYLIPEKATSITFTADIYNDGKLVKSQDFTSTLNTDLAMSTSYNFTAVINQTALKLNKIEFNATVGPWGEDQEVSVTVPQN